MQACVDGARCGAGAAEGTSDNASQDSAPCQVDKGKWKACSIMSWSVQTISSFPTASMTKVLGVSGAGEPLRSEAASGHIRLFYRHEGNTFCVNEPIDDSPATAGNGSTIAFKCGSLAQVREFHDTAVANGGTSIEVAPGPHNSNWGRSTWPMCAIPMATSSVPFIKNRGWSAYGGRSTCTMRAARIQRSPQRALESAVKIVNAEPGCPTGREPRAWRRSSTPWPVGRMRPARPIGRGDAEALLRRRARRSRCRHHASAKLDTAQTAWAIEFCMIGVKSILLRL